MFLQPNSNIIFHQSNYNVLQIHVAIFHSFLLLAISKLFLFQDFFKTVIVSVFI